MGVLVITRGIPAAGKTTWAKAWVAEAPNRARVNRDDIRMMLFGRYTDVDEQAVTKVVTASMRSLMFAGWDVVLDATNLNPRHLGNVRRLARHVGYKVQVRDFDIDVDEAIVRDALRDRGVGPDVIRRMAEQYGRG
jgi:predicted kinase